MVIIQHCNLTNRDIVFIPSNEESIHAVLNKYVLIKASHNRPMFALWFEEFIYSVGHFQSIVPRRMTIQS